MSDKLRQLSKNIEPQITNEVVDNKLVITLSGTVGTPYPWENEEDFINIKQVKRVIGDTDKDILIKLNSPGGSVFDGIEVYNYLKGLSNHVTIEVTALAASAASVIAMSADVLTMCTGSQLMIHEASTFTYGNKVDHHKTINALETIDSSLVSVYADRTGLDAETINNWLSEEKWFTAEEAVEHGMADGIKAKVEPKPPSATVTINAEKISEIFDNSIQKYFEDQKELEREAASHLENKEEHEKNKPTGLNKLFGGTK